MMQLLISRGEQMEGLEQLLMMQLLTFQERMEGLMMQPLKQSKNPELQTPNSE